MDCSHHLCCIYVTGSIVGSVSPWFHKSTLNRNSSENALKLAYSQSSIEVHNMVIVRYSSKEENHFVVSVYAPGGKSFQHIGVVNGPEGYCVVGDTSGCYSTVLDLVQAKIFDPRSTTGSTIELDRANVGDWNELKHSLVVKLDSNHYASVESLTAATESLDLNEMEDGDVSSASKRCANASLGALFGKSVPPLNAGGIDDCHTDDKSVPKPPSVANATDLLSNEPNSHAQSMIGMFMLKQSLDLLIQSGTITKKQAEQIKNIVVGC